ncbi:retrotransposon line subclass [Hordeum vulgare]|nr:retrotransposon line subclass [Hordeum vulgare]
MKLRVRLYTNDAIIFANPVKQEIDHLMSILHSFGDASGLRINPSKSTATLICYDNNDLESALESFGGMTLGFLVRYLGLHLTTNTHRLFHLQYILDRIRSRLAGWNRRMLSIAGIRVLVCCILTALPTFALTALRAPKKLLMEIDKASASFCGYRRGSSREAAARITGAECAPCAAWGAEHSEYAKILVEPYGCDGSGMHGTPLTGLGWDRPLHVMPIQRGAYCLHRQWQYC